MRVRPFRRCAVGFAGTVAALLIATSHLAAQAAPSRSSTTLNVYLDCNDFEGCDFDFFRTEITSVNWVRDRQVSDIHLLVTTAQTGAGGREYTTTFIGLRNFSGLTDTLKYVSEPAAARDQIRRGLAQVFRAGLVRYQARTPALSTLSITGGGSATGEGKAAQTSAKNDKWNYWVFRTSINGYRQGEATYRSGNINGSISANRVTDAWKTNISLNQSYNQSDYTLSDGGKFKTIQRSYGANLLEVKSLGPHWSAGLRSSFNSSTYENQRRSFSVNPAIEYDIFPYSQSTRRQIRIEYNIGTQLVAYNDTTVLDKLRQSLPSHSLNIATAAREPWGSVDVGINGTNYLHDRSKYRLSTFGSVNLNLIKGLSLNVFADYSKFNDQFYLPKKSFTDEEILTRQFARETRYRYFVNFGLSYTFGSIFNNVVNPRFGGGGGGFFMMM